MYVCMYVCMYVDSNGPKSPTNLVKFPVRLCSQLHIAGH